MNDAALFKKIPNFVRNELSAIISDEDTGGGDPPLETQLLVAQWSCVS